MIKNPKLDTELRIFNGQNGYEIFVKHSGLNTHTLSSPRPIEISYDNVTKNLTLNSPLPNENFEYHIYIDKIEIIKKQNFTICHLAEVTKLGHHKITKYI